jgi:hypothetical protein
MPVRSRADLFPLAVVLPSAPDADLGIFREGYAGTAVTLFAYHILLFAA